jgi:hypothetical protein
LSPEGAITAESMDKPEVKEGEGAADSPLRTVFGHGVRLPGGYGIGRAAGRDLRRALGMDIGTDIFAGKVLGIFSGRATR